MEPAQRPSRGAALGGAPQDEECGAPQDQESCENGAQAGSGFVTDFAAQPFEITRRLPELQPASEDGGEPSEPGAASEEDAGSAPSASARAPGGSAFVTGFGAQAVEIMESLPELQPASEDNGKAPRRTPPLMKTPNRPPRRARRLRPKADS
jgi:hypothetical protein